MKNANPVPPLRLSDRDFSRFSTLVRERTGISYSTRRRSQFAAGIYEAAARCGFDDLDEYFLGLKSRGLGTSPWDELMAWLTVGETYFFRDAAQIQALRTRILPELVEKNRETRTLRFWSAGCATGEEPFTLAILLREILPDLERWEVTILATDINRTVLEKAREGRFREWSFRKTPPEFKRRYFAKTSGVYVLPTKIRRMVNFAPLNLMERTYPSPATGTSHMDLILCRNVVIYLAPDFQGEIVERLARCLTPGGYLLLSAAESPGSRCPRLSARLMEGAIVYQETLKAGVLSGPLENGKKAFEKDPGAERPVSRFANPRPQKDLQGPGTAAAQGAPNPDPPPSKARFSDKEALLREVRSLADRGELAAGERLCREALAKDPACRDTRYFLGAVLLEQGRLEEAEKELAACLYLDPDCVMARTALVSACRRSGRPEEAERHARAALAVLRAMEQGAVLALGDGATAGELREVLERTHARSAPGAAS